MNKSFFSEYFKKLSSLVLDVDHKKLHSAAKKIHSSNKKGGKVIIVGNGGSAGIANHATMDFTKVAGYRAVNFNESSTITCLANDYGYENWVKMAIKFMQIKMMLWFSTLYRKATLKFSHLNTSCISPLKTS